MESREEHDDATSVPARDANALYVPYRDRVTKPGRRVRVARCFEQPGVMWFVQQDGRIVAHARSLLLRNVRFVVHEVRRQRMLREGRKNVHAFIEGILAPSEEAGFGWPEEERTLGVRVFYDPSAYGSFRTIDTLEPVWEAAWGLVNQCGVSILRYHDGVPNAA